MNFIKKKMMETLALKDTLAGEDLKGALKEDKIEGNFMSKIESHYVSCSNNNSDSSCG
jgi:hypothetical protein